MDEHEDAIEVVGAGHQRASGGQVGTIKGARRGTIPGVVLTPKVLDGLCFEASVLEHAVSGKLIDDTHRVQ